jgi:hypothetical protein
MQQILGAQDETKAEFKRGMNLEAGLQRLAGRTDEIA